MPSWTPFHAIYFAHELTRRFASDNPQKLNGTLADARVDLNPHQIDAALFAFRTPLHQGAILADEVGLGKTIEAGLLLAQKWAEGKRRLLVMGLANLRKQWAQELEEKFHLPTAILESRTSNQAISHGNLNPFVQDAVLICSYQFARNKSHYIRQAGFDLVVIDEAHRLRNVYKGTGKIAKDIKALVAPFPKVLLTATPFQNNLLELYGLVSIVDEFAFGDVDSFRAQFSRLQEGEAFDALKRRLAPICKRTLRRDVQEFVRYTQRNALVQEFAPSRSEQDLYDAVTEYLHEERLYALPAGQRQLMTLLLRKLLASSTFAIAKTLDALAAKLEKALEVIEHVSEDSASVNENIVQALAESDEVILPNADDGLEDEEDDESENESSQENSDRPTRTFSIEERQAALKEVQTLRNLRDLAQAIASNSKGEVLLAALRKGFADAQAAQERGNAPTLFRKAIIFTESRRTQDYLLNILEGTEFAGKVVAFNGSNNDAKSQSIYSAWIKRHEGGDKISGSPNADKRAALVDWFREEGEILVATEAAAEGINSGSGRDRYLENLWKLTELALKPFATFSTSPGFNSVKLQSQILGTFNLQARPSPELNIPLGKYYLDYGGHVSDEAQENEAKTSSSQFLGHRYRPLHPLARFVLNESMLLRFPAHEISFFIAPNEPRSHALESLRGQRGWLLAKKLSLIAIDQEDTILLMGLTDQGQILEDESRSLRQDLNKLEREIEDAARASRQAPTMPAKLDWQRRKRLLEDRRDTAEKAYEAAKQEVRHQKDLRLEEIGTQLEQQSQEQTLFAFRWFLA